MRIVGLDGYQILKYQRLLAFYWLIKYAFVSDGKIIFPRM